MTSDGCDGYVVPVHHEKLARGDSISLFLRSLADFLECGTEVFMENIVERIVLKA